MALSPREITITREDVHGWLEEYEGQQRATKKLRDYLSEKIIEADLDPEATVDTTSNDSLTNETALVDMILLDIESYA